MHSIKHCISKIHGLDTEVCSDRTNYLKYKVISPGWAFQLVRASSQYAKIALLIPGRGTDKDQQMNK